MSRLRLATIGSGNQASRQIHPAIIRVPELDWVAACDLVEEKVQATADLYNITPYTDMTEMLEAEQPQAVCVVGPPQVHHEVGLAVLRAGCHLVCEKPPADTAAEAKQLADAAREAGKLGMMLTHWRHSPAHQRAQELMQTDEFGQPIFYQGHFHAPGPSDFWNYLLYQGVHLVDCTRHLMGDITEVFAHCSGPEDGTLGISVTLRFANGASGVLAMAGGFPILKSGVWLLGTGKQSIRVDDLQELRFSCMPPWIGEGHYFDWPEQTWQSGAPYISAQKVPYVEEMSHFARAVLAGEQPLASLDDGHQAMRVLEAIRQSMEGGGVVSL